MKSRCACVFVVFLCLFMSVRHLRADAELRVDETAVKLSIRENPPTLALPVENPLGKSVAVRLSIDVLDPRNRLRSAVTVRKTIPPGRSVWETPIAETNESFLSTHWLSMWDRLRYRLEPESADDFTSVQGILSFSEIIRDYFALRMTAPRHGPGSTRYGVTVTTFNPHSDRPVANVRISGQITFTSKTDAEKPVSVSASGVTDSTGIALLEFDVPSVVSGRRADITVQGQSGDFIQKLHAGLESTDSSTVILNTDKPLHQPGQTLHARALVFDAMNRAQVGKPCSFRITDGQGNEVFQKSVNTSRFGVASVDWPIPTETAPGNYRVSAELEGEEAESSAIVKISRYELPTFTVRTEPNRSYYLPGQNAEVEIKAAHLFGKPVKDARVRVAREPVRYGAGLAYSISTQPPASEGVTDDAGRFTARLDLSDCHAELEAVKLNDYKDFTFIASCTDPTDGRTEQGRFDVRVTREAIHVYAYRRDPDDGFPRQVYLTTSHADGTPAPCTVTVSSKSDNRTANDKPPAPLFVTTNRLGLAKIEGVPLLDSNTEITFTARDRFGRVGHGRNLITRDDDDDFRLDTDKSVYRPGEPIRLRISASESIEPNALVTLDVAGNQGTVHTRPVRLRNRQASVVVPFDQSFKGPVTLSLHDPSRPGGYDPVLAHRTVLFVHNPDLKLNVALDKAEYRPGEDVRAAFSVGADGQAIEGALGVRVVDQAVWERIRADSEARTTNSERYETEIGGVTLRDLTRLNPAKLIPREFDLAAELFFNISRDDFPSPARLVRETPSNGIGYAFHEAFDAQFNPVRSALERWFSQTPRLPGDETARRAFLQTSDIDLEALRDPWGTPYRYRFFFDRNLSRFEATSAGPDKRSGTPDDLQAATATLTYARKIGEALNQTAREYVNRTGRRLFDDETFNRELRRDGFDLDTFRDPWGNAYELRVIRQGTTFRVQVFSAGPDGRFHTPETPSSDDFEVEYSGFDFYVQTRLALNSALNAFKSRTGRLPNSERDVRDTFTAVQINPKSLIDPWGNGYVLKFTSEPKLDICSTLGTRLSSLLQTANGSIRATHYSHTMTVIGKGEDGREGTADDFVADTFSHLELVPPRTDAGAEAPNIPLHRRGFGAAAGTVTDQTQAVIAGAVIKLTNQATGVAREVETSETGCFVVENLEPGLYRVEAQAQGFKNWENSSVFVAAGYVTIFDAVLEVGSMAEVIAVSAFEPIESPQKRAKPAGEQPTPRRRNLEGVSLSTPRVRRYFPETLLWQPELTTDATGRARLAFKLADNITTWKLSVMASSADGRIGLAESDITAFQPFFIEHNPPPVLTEGDEIDLPVAVRNYLPRSQSARLEMKPEPWFSILGPATKRIRVASGASVRETFPIRAVAAVTDGKQTVSALGGQAGDTVEKTVTVHADGEERFITQGALFNDSATFGLQVPENAIPGTIRARLKLYPNFMAHATEGIEGILQRPHGCAEQTISSTYPNVFLLRHLTKQNRNDDLTTKARTFVREGYERLLGYQTSEGGFGYWSKASPDVALTAHALRFLKDAREFTSVDEKVVERARAWIEESQAENGTWGRSVQTTALVTRSLAGIDGETEPSDALKKALAFLEQQVRTETDAYTLACFALAALDAGDDLEGKAALDRLRTFADTEWQSDLTTPFHGWGLAGNLETTALVVRALARADENDPLVNSGLLFLLKNKDRHGVWYSTQATVNVLDTLTRLERPSDTLKMTAPRTAHILVNDKPVKTVELPAKEASNAPISIPIPEISAPGANRIEIRLSGDGSRMSAQAVAECRVPWTETRPSAKSDFLSLSVKFDKRRASVGEDIVCTIQAGRLDTRHLGMLLAEIGLPPAVEVDRSSLDALVQSETVSSYDILPDRVVFYFWSSGARSFAFTFRPRTTMRAKSAPSILYDYYNPDAQTTVAPVRFEVW